MPVREAIRDQKPVENLFISNEFDPMATYENQERSIVGENWNTVLATGVLATAAVAGGLAYSDMPKAEAASQPAATVTVTKVTQTVGASSASAREVASINLNGTTVLAFRRAKGTPARVLRGLEGERNTDKCRVTNNFYNSGTVLGRSTEHPLFFRDHKLSIVCRNENSPTGWIKVGLAKNKSVLKDGFQKYKDIIPGTDCFNIIKPIGGKKPTPIVPRAIVVRSFNEGIKLHVDAEASAYVDCGAGNTASAKARGSADARITIREILQTRGQARAYVVERAKMRAIANAQTEVHCNRVDTNTTTTVEVPVCPPGTTGTPPNCVTPTPPKDGTQGAGAGTPGQPGGPGAGGTPGNATESYICRDDASTVNGDLNPATDGALMASTGPGDQFGYCVGRANPLQ